MRGWNGVFFVYFIDLLLLSTLKRSKKINKRQTIRVISKSHRKRFLFVELIQMPLRLLSLLRKFFFFWFLLNSPLVLKGRFWLVSPKKKIGYGDFLKIAEKTPFHARGEIKPIATFLIN